MPGIAFNCRKTALGSDPVEFRDRDPVDLSSFVVQVSNSNFESARNFIIDVVEREIRGNGEAQ